MRNFTVLLAALVLVVLAPAPVIQSASPFDTVFTGDTMRVDYYHNGGRGTETVALDRVLNDGPWPGNRTRLVDDTNLGRYLFEVIDRDTNQVIYSRGFASVYGEWESTSDAKDVYGTFQESVRFPWPKRPVQVVLKRRDHENAFHEFSKASDSIISYYNVLESQIRQLKREIEEKNGELLRAKEYLYTILDSLPVGVVVVDKESILFSNTKAEELGPDGFISNLNNGAHSVGELRNGKGRFRWRKEKLAKRFEGKEVIVFEDVTK